MSEKIPDYYTPMGPSEEKQIVEHQIKENQKAIDEAEACLARLKEERDDLQQEWRSYNGI